MSAHRKQSKPAPAPPIKPPSRPAVDPDELTSELRERILTELRGGVPLKRVARAVGISLERLLTWLESGRREPEGPVGAFARVVDGILLRRRMERR